MKTLFFLALVAMAFMIAPVAHATLLNPGDSCSGACTTPAQPAGSGTMIDTTGIQTMTFGSAKNGFTTVKFETEVYREVGGNLDFYYQFSVAATKKGFVDHLSINDFTGFTTDVGAVNFNLPGFVGPTALPTNTTRSSDGSNLDFFFNEIHNGTTTFTLLVETNATSYDGTTDFVQDGGQVEFNAFEPMTTPEPASIVLFGTVLALSGLVARRKFAKKM